MPESKRLYTFDAVRGIAAIAVVLFHMGQYFPHRFAASGYLSVDIFFVLSGYVIGRAYTDRLRSGWTAWQMARTRLIRLYPLFAVGVAFGIMKAVAQIVVGDPGAPGIADLAGQIVFNGLALPYPLPWPETFPLNQPSWSLFLEIAINILFGLWMFRARWQSLALFAVLGAVLLTLGAVSAGSMNIGWNWPTFGAGVGRSVFSFTIGVLIERQMRRSGRLVRMTWRAVVPVAIVVAMLGWNDDGAYRVPFDIAFVLVVSPGIVIAAANWELPRPLHRAAGLLGDLSFPLYAVHYPLLLVCRFATTKLGITGNAQFAFIFVVTLAAAMLAARIDGRVRAMISDRLGIRRSATPNVV